MLDSIVGAGLNYLGARHANNANRQMAQDQMGFQERMSNTSYQRAMQDMRSAGLNPMLASNLGGASSPGGSSASMMNEASGAVSSAIDARRAKAEVDNMRAQNVNLHAQTGLIQAQTKQALQSSAKSSSDSVRQWSETLGKGAKDTLPWILYALSRGRVKPR